MEDDKSNDESFAGQLHDEIALSRPVVAVHENDLLPRPEQKPPGLKGNGQRGADHGSPDMTVPVAVSPGVVVMVRMIGRGDAFERLGKIMRQSGLVLDCRDSSRCSGCEHKNLSLRHAASGKNGGDLLGDVVQTGIAPCLEADVFGEDFHAWRNNLPRVARMRKVAVTESTAVFPLRIQNFPRIA
jgi:hypothetical protein